MRIKNHEQLIVKWSKEMTKAETNGLETEWYENGQKKVEVNNKDGWEDGLWTEWYDNGQKSSEGNYKDGKEDGNWTYWNEEGNFAIAETWKDGEVVK